MTEEQIENWPEELEIIRNDVYTIVSGFIHTSAGAVHVFQRQGTDGDYCCVIFTFELFGKLLTKTTHGQYFGIMALTEEAREFVSHCQAHRNGDTLARGWCDQS